mgnify:CR=1 FL=1
MLGRIIALLIGYGFGLVLMGYFLGKTQNVDLTKVGSGNVGSTNTLRNLGPKAGAFTLVCDCLKCVLAVLFVGFIFSFFYEDTSIYQVYAGLGAVLGHDFPVYMHFKGGKGIASTLGFIIAIIPLGLPIPALIFLIIVLITKYVSLGSIIGVFSFAVQIIIFAALGLITRYKGTELIEMVVICCLVSLIAILLHHANIKRLLNGNENKISFKPETRE